MQSSSSSSKPTIIEEQQQGLLTPPHEYIRYSFSSFRYKNCISCGNRTEYTCIKCGYCYSCHWKREQCEETELRDNNLKDFYVSMSKKASNNKDNQKKIKEKQQTVQLKKTKPKDRKNREHWMY
jgi:hypothetical protein